MVTQASDSFTREVNALFPDASANMGGDLSGTMPTANGPGGPSEVAIPGQAAPGQGEPDFDYASLPEDLRGALDQHFERTFVQGHKAELQRSYEGQINQVRQELGSQLGLAEANVRELTTFRRKAIEYLNGYIKQVSEGKHQPDPRDMAQFLVATQGAVSQEVQQDQNWRNDMHGHIQRDRDAHDRVVQSSASFTSPDGQRHQVFDPQNPEVRDSFSRYESALKNAYAAPNDTQRQLAAAKAFGDYQLTLERVKRDGQLALLAKLRAATGDTMTARRDVQAARGAQNYSAGGGGAAGMTFQQHLDAASAELGKPTTDDNVFSWAMYKQRQVHEAQAARAGGR